MRSILRWFQRIVLLLVGEEWAKARVDMKTAISTHHVEAAIAAELRIFRSALTGLKELEREAARAVADSPASVELTAAMLRERMSTLVHAVNEAAAKRPAP